MKDASGGGGVGGGGVGGGVVVGGAEIAATAARTSVVHRTRLWWERMLVSV